MLISHYSNWSLFFQTSEKKEKKLKTFQNGRQYRCHNGKKRWKIDLWTHLYIHVQIQICRIQQIERMWIEFNQIDVKRLWPFFSTISTKLFIIETMNTMLSACLTSILSIEERVEFDKLQHSKCFTTKNRTIPIATLSWPVAWCLGILAVNAVSRLALWRFSVRFCVCFGF